MNINKTYQAGRITSDLKLEKLPSGTSVLKFSLANNKVWKDKNGDKQEKVNFHNLVAMGKTAEIISQYCSKGDGLFVEGSVENSSWEKDGKKYYKTEIVVSEFQFGQKSSKNASETPQNARTSDLNDEMSLDTVVSNLSSTDEDLSDLPF